MTTPSKAGAVGASFGVSRLVGGAALLLLGSGSALAQTATAPSTKPAPDAAVEEIVVTAQRRSERLQDVPIAVSALSSTQLASRGVAQITDLRVAITGLNVVDSASYATPRLRGVGSTAFGPGVENAVATYLDGVYIGSAQSTLMSFNNISRIEVLKGPQGTLFGRNATGGLIQVITRDPGREATGEINASYANYDTASTTGYLSTPITSSLAADVAWQYARQGEGWGKNRFTGSDVDRLNHDFAIRSKWLFTPSADTRVTVIGDFMDRKGSTLAYVVQPNTRSPFVPGLQNESGWDLNANEDPHLKGRGGGVSGKIEHQFGGVRVSSLTAYRKSRFDLFFDLDATTAPVQLIHAVDKENQFSEELQASSASAGRLQWVAGLYYFDAQGQYAPIRAGVPAIGIDVFTRSEQDTRSISGYAQGTYQVLDGTNLTLGARYTTERRQLTGKQNIFLFETPTSIAPELDVDRRNTFSKLTFRVAVDHKFSRDMMVYASLNRGFKSGGFNAGSITDPPFKPETLDAYEVGLKSTMLDRRVRLNLAGYYYDYKNVQVQLLRTGSVGIVNAKTARTYGLDAESEVVLTNALHVSAGVELLDAKFKRFDLAGISTPLGGTPLIYGSASGNEMPLASKFTANLSVDYKTPVGPGDLTLNASGYYNSGWFTEPDNVIRQPRFVQLNLSAQWARPSGFSVSVWGRNVTNVRTTALGETTVEGTHLALWSAPRTYGITVGYAF